MWVIRGESTPHQVIFWSEILEPLCVSVAFFESPDPEVWILEGVCQVPPDLVALEVIVNTSLVDGYVLPCFSLSPLPETNWLEENRQSFPPLHIGGFYIYGSHHELPPNLEKIPLQLDAATAFGSGHHGTTQGCLHLLEAVHAQATWTKALDLGCGSGILALGMACLNPHARVWAADNDPEAVGVTRKNSRLNNQNHLIEARVSEGMAQLEDAGPFDLIMANILAQPLVILAPDIAACLGPGGNLIVSGFLTSQQDTVQASYEQLGFRAINRVVLDDWVALWLQGPRTCVA